MRGAGVEVAAILDLRASADIQDAAAADGFTVRAGAAPTNTRGRPVLSSVRWHRVNAAGQAQAGEGGDIACDALLVSGGWNPPVHLLSQSGGGLRFDETLQAFVPSRSVQLERSVGAANGEFSSRLNVAPLQTVDVSALVQKPNRSE